MIKTDESGQYFQVCYVSPPKKAQFWDAYMRFWFWCTKHGRWLVFFLEDRFSAFDRDLKNKKIMVPVNP